MNKFLFAALVLLLSALTARAAPAMSAQTPLRIAHVMSYHTGWSWSEDQFEGFRQALKGLNIEYRTFEMDTKHKPSTAWKEEVGARIRSELAQYKPDLVYLTDDNAQLYIGKYFANQATAVVFSGINGEFNDYYQGARNVTGVLEREPVTETVKLVSEISPGIKRIVVLSDIDVSWVDIVKRLQKQVPQKFPGIEMVTPEPFKTFEEYKATILKYQNTPTAFASLGIYALKDEKGNVVPFQDVIRWTAENSRNPDFTFWGDRVQYGTLCAISLSGYEQGFSAGSLARRILANKASPANLAVIPVTKGKPVINYARARLAGLTIRSTLLLSSTVIPYLGWEAPRGQSTPNP